MVLKKQKVPVVRKAIVASEEVGPEGFYPIGVIDDKLNTVNKNINAVKTIANKNTDTLTNTLKGSQPFSRILFNTEQSANNIFISLADNGNLEFSSSNSENQPVNFDLLKNGSKILTENDLNTTTALNINTLTTTGKVKVGGQLEVTNAATFNNTVTFGRDVTASNITANNITVKSGSKLIISDGSQIAFNGGSGTVYLERRNNELFFNNKSLGTSFDIVLNEYQAENPVYKRVLMPYTYNGRPVYKIYILRRVQAAQSKDTNFMMYKRENNNPIPTFNIINARSWCTYNHVTIVSGVEDYYNYGINPTMPLVWVYENSYRSITEDDAPVEVNSSHHINATKNLYGINVKWTNPGQVNTVPYVGDIVLEIEFFE